MTNKKIEKLPLEKDEHAYLEIDQGLMPELYVDITGLVVKINEIIEVINDSQGEDR